MTDSLLTAIDDESLLDRYETLNREHKVIGKALKSVRAEMARRKLTAEPEWEFSHHPGHYFIVESIPWTTPCGLLLHSPDGVQISATTDKSKVECAECRTKLGI